MQTYLFKNAGLEIKSHNKWLLQESQFSEKCLNLQRSRNPLMLPSKAQAKTLRQCHDGFSCWAETHARLSNDFITAKQ